MLAFSSLRISTSIIAVLKQLTKSLLNQTPVQCFEHMILKYVTIEHKLNHVPLM